MRGLLLETFVKDTVIVDPRRAAPEFADLRLSGTPIKYIVITFFNNKIKNTQSICGII